MKRFIQFYFSPKGRLSRKDYWLRFFMPYLSMMLCLSITDVLAGTFNETFQFGYMSLSFFILTLYSALIVSYKRLQERQRPGWLIVLLPIPLINLWILTELLLMKGKETTSCTE